ncbi:MAG: ribosome assembly factor SBDS [Candidatus Brockarchaeota archaeon]|nr:ribosome assembly factor SBDS [Candidatus Brockarchaeota archaeon]
MSSKSTVARLSVGGDRFEILVDPDSALAYRLGKKKDISKILVTDQVFTDSKKGLRAQSEKLESKLGTRDVLKAAAIILEKGELLLTVEQRRALIEEKRKQIVVAITRSCTDARTGLPIPATRVEQALAQVGVKIDPFKSGEEQAKAIMQELKKVLPMKVQTSEIEVRAPKQIAQKVQAVCKALGDVLAEKTLQDESVTMNVSVPLVSKAAFLEKLDKEFGRQVQANVLK